MTGIVYHRYGYDGSHRVEIGESIEHKRICRFCGKKMPEVTFKNIAHAISESIGCKEFFNYEECDSCNKKFAPMEQDFYRRHAFDLSFFDIEGKKGCREIETKDFSISGIKGMVPINIKSVEKFNKILADIEQGKDAILLSAKKTISKYTPQNIYKCLCKYVLGMLESEFLPHFKDTIDWINSELCPRVLPSVLVYRPNSILTHPRIAYFIRVQGNEDFPFAIGCLEFANQGYFFLIPFCQGENLPKPDSKVYQKFKESFCKIVGNRPYKERDLSEHTKKTPSLRLDLQNIVLGETAFIQNTTDLYTQSKIFQ